MILSTYFEHKYFLNFITICSLTFFISNSKLFTWSMQKRKSFQESDKVQEEKPVIRKKSESETTEELNQKFVEVVQ